MPKYSWLGIYLSCVSLACGANDSKSGSASMVNGVGGSSSSAGASRSASAGASGSLSTTGGTSGAPSAGGASQGAAGAAGSTATTGGNGGGAAGAPARTVGDCTKLGAVGTWERLSLPGVSLDPNFQTPAGTNYGIGNFVLDPLHSGTVYVGTSAQGIFKTTDCGATWVHINTGRNGDQLDAGRQWTMQIDPIDSQVIYTVAGYGHENGAWKSTNGGKDWDQLFPASVADAFVYGGFTARIAMDPTDHLHLLVTPHFTCQGAHSSNCMLETNDAGKTWKVLENGPATAEGGGIPMLDAKTWLWLTQAGIWRTTDAGTTWQQVNTGKVSDGFYQGKDGSLYAGADPNILRSTDNGLTWTSLGNSTASVSIVGDGTRMFSSNSVCTGRSDTAFQPYSGAIESDPSKWTQIASPPMFVGGRQIAFDPDHHVLYSDSCLEGFWRAVIE
jgi:hypothetical protein